MDSTSVENILASESEQGAVWSVRPFQLVSLLMILKKYGQAFFRIGELLSTLSTLENLNLPALFESFHIDTKDLRRPLDEEGAQFLYDNLKIMLTYCEAAELTSSAQGIKRILELPDGLRTPSGLQALMVELSNRLRDELENRRFLYIPDRNVERYESNSLFGDKVAKKFAKSTADIQEAGKCFAAGRYTACVFHLMRVMERGVQRLGKKLKVTIPVEEKDWGKISTHINGALNRLPNSTVQEKRVHTRYTKAAVYLDNVREAWRNPTMHPKETYTEEEADDCFRFVKQYMEYLAKIL
jgi:HEPN domain-containing protein